MVWQHLQRIAVAVEISNVGKERETVTSTVIANQAYSVAKTTAKEKGSWPRLCALIATVVQNQVI